MHFAPTIFALACGLFGSTALASDALQAPACRGAVESLQAAEGALIAATRAEMPRDDEQARLRSRLLVARKAVVRVCLGGADDAPVPTRSAAPARPGVPPVHADRPAAPPPSRSAAAPAPAPPPLRTITSCDALGCWANDGTRLQKSGPNLLGPGGFCSLQGAVLHCP